VQQATVIASATATGADVTDVVLIVNGGTPRDLFDGSSSAPVAISELVTLAIGANTIEVRATDSRGGTTGDTVVVTYSPAPGADVRWDGDAGDDLWTTPTNWNTDQVPGPGANVFIDNPADTVIHTLAAAADTTSIRSLTSRGGLVLRAPGILHLAAASTIEGGLDLEATAGGSTIVLADSLHLPGGFRWQGGSFSGGVVHLPVGATGLMELPATAFLLEGTSLVVAGSLDVGRGRSLFVDDSAQVTVENGGRLTLQDVAVVSCLGGCQGKLINRGDVTLVGPTLGTLNISVENEGLIEGLAGAVHLASARPLAVGVNRGTIIGNGVVFGSWDNAAGSSVSATFVRVDGAVTVGGSYQALTLTDVPPGGSLSFGPGSSVISTLGTLRINGTVDVNNGNTIEMDRLELSSGTLRARSNVRLNVFAQFDWSSGTLTGPGQTVVQARLTSETATLNLTAGASGDKRLDGHTLITRDDAFWLSGDILGGNGAVIENAGTFDIRGNDRMDGNDLGGTDMTFQNNVSIIKSQGGGTSTMEVCFVRGSSGGTSGQETVLSGVLNIIDLCP